MSIETPSDRAVFQLCEWTAGALIFGLIEGLSTNKSVITLCAYGILAIVFAVVGARWTTLKLKLRPRFSAFNSRTEQIASGYRYRTGAAFLLLGFFTGSAFSYVHAIRSDLDAYVTPRSIGREQVSKLKDFLSKHDAYAVSIKVVQHDPEAMEYAAQLFNAMRQTNWDINPPNHGGPDYVHFPVSTGKPRSGDLDAKGKPLYKSTDEYLDARDVWLEREVSNKIDEQTFDANGLCIEVEQPGQPTNPDPRHPTPEDILKEGMRYAGIEVNCSGGANGRTKFMIYLLVGHRPRVIGDQEPNLVKIGRWIQELGQ